MFFGSIADLFGRKSMFIASMLLFSIFSLGAGFAQSGITLDILCGVLGIWSAAAVPPAQGMLGTVYEASFFFIAIVYFCVTIIAYFTVPNDTTPKHRLDDETLKKLDLPGTGMTILGIGMFCAALR
jgi:MFS family permease